MGETHAIAWLASLELRARASTPALVLSVAAIGTGIGNSQRTTQRGYEYIALRRLFWYVPVLFICIQFTRTDKLAPKFLFFKFMFLFQLNKAEGRKELPIVLERLSQSTDKNLIAFCTELMKEVK
jgi:hypothetical protein